MSSFTLDDIRAAAETKYGATEIDLGGDTKVRLLNPLRLSKAKRDALVALQKELDHQEDGAEEGTEHIDQEGAFKETIRLVAESQYQAETLLSAVGDDLAVLAEIVERYSRGTQVGEASASDD